MLSSLKGDSIVKGIPTYILAIAIVVPILLFSGALGGVQLGRGSSGTGMYDFLDRNWKSWSDDEWDIFLDLVVQLDEDEDTNDLPENLLDFGFALENMSDEERMDFDHELEDRMMQRYGLNYYDYY